MEATSAIVMLKLLHLSNEINHGRGSFRNSFCISTKSEVVCGGVFLSAALNARSKSMIDSCVLARRISSLFMRSSSGPTTCQFPNPSLQAFFFFFSVRCHNSRWQFTLFQTYHHNWELLHPNQTVLVCDWPLRLRLQARRG